MQAKRQGRLWDRRIKGYNTAKEKYETLQRELGSRMLADIVNDGSLSDADKNAAVLYYIFEEQNRLRQETKDRVKNTHIKRFVAKFGDWLNDGEKNRWWSKFGRGVLVGAGAGVVGAGVGLLFGAAGMGAAVVGAGVELAQALIELAAKNDWRVMLVGGWGDRAQRSAANFVKKWPKLKIKAIEGEPTMSHKDTLRHINDYSPAVLLVAYGMRKQEEWVQENKDRLDFGVAVGVGRSFDYWSGELKRAPAGVRKMGLEWLYSLYKEPKRWRRQLALLEFVKKVVYK
jgi:N-acetylglucosaminyldiphosphoundecaprenol N-acetyl-beta-D-mannosaminyltransferase